MDTCATSLSGYDTELAEAGLALISCRTEDEVFEVISAVIARIVPETTVIVAQATTDQTTFIIRDILGMEEPVIAKAGRMIGSDIRGRHSAVEGPFREYYTQRRLVELPGSVAELASTEISPVLGKLAGAVFGAGAAFTIGIADEHTMFGALHFLTRDRDAPLPALAIELFVYQGFLTLSQLHTQSALRESEAKYRMLTESIKDVVWILDPETMRFLYVSPSVERLRGYTPEEVIAEPMDAALTPEGAAYVTELLRKRAAAFLLGQGPPEGFFTEELEQPCKDGSSVLTEVITSYYVNSRNGRIEVRGVTRDITERRRSEESLRVFAELLEASPASIAVFTPEGETLYANERTLEMHGYTRDEFLPLNLHDVDVPESAELIEERFEWTREHGENSFEVEHYRKDGTVLPLAVNNRVAMWEGREVILSVATDITERRRVEAELLEGHARLEQMVYDVAEAMGRIVEARDPYTQGHEVRVAELAKRIAAEMRLSDDEIDGVEMAAVVHDIGKLSVPVEILNRPGKLSEVEFQIIKQHPTTGYEILKGIAFPWNVAQSVLQHHERADGSGYPLGLAGEEICRSARILAVADVIEAMASRRPYRQALGVDAAVEEIDAHREKYDPDVVDACMRLYESGSIVW